MKTEGTIKCLAFTQEHIAVLLEGQKLLTSPLTPLRALIRPTSQRKTHSEYIYLPSTSYDLLLNVDFPTSLIHQDRLYYSRPGSLYCLSLVDPLAQPIVTLLCFDCFSPALLADCQLHSLLHAQELITCSYVVVEHSWPLYIVGTSLGRVFIVPLASSLSVSCLESGIEDEISCLAFTNDRLVSCSRCGQIDVWSLSQDDVSALKQYKVQRHLSEREKYQLRRVRSYSMHENLQNQLRLITSFRLTHGPIVAIVLPTCMEGTKKEMAGESWQATLEEWEQMVVGQMDDGLILVISIAKQDLHCMLTGVGDVIIKATVNIPLEYLLIETEDESLYVYNTMNQQLERYLSNTVTSDFVGEARDRKKRRPVHHTYAQQLLEVTLAGVHSVSAQQEVWTECRLVGKTQFPLLCIRPEQIINSILQRGSLTEEAKFAVSLLIRWDHAQTAAERLIQTQVELLFEASRLSMAAAVGVFGVEEAVSFPFPSSPTAPWQLSPYLSTVTALSLVSILNACAKSLPNAKAILQKTQELHASGLAENCPGFQRHLTALIGAKILEGNQAAYIFLKHLFQGRDMDDFAGYWTAFLPPGARRNSKGVFEESKQKLVPEAAIAVVLLATAALQRPLHAFSVDTLLRYLTYLLESLNENEVKAAAWLLIDGIKAWRDHSSKDSVAKATLALLAVHHSGPESTQTLILSTLLQVGKADVLLFCSVLKSEVAKWSIGRDYPQCILSVLEAFIYKHPTSLLFLIPAVVEVILRSLDRQDIFLRKICVSKASNALEQLVKRLPMTAFDAQSQRLAIGTPEGKLLLYSLAGASLWKSLDAHLGPSNAVAFKPGGSVVVSYCMQEAKLCYWTIAAGFFGLGQESVERGKVLALEAVQPAVKSTSELLEVVKVKWAKDRFHLVRENSRSYAFE